MTRHQVTLLRQGNTTPKTLRVTSLLFSAGEVQVKVEVPAPVGTGEFRITAILDSSQALMELLLLTDALRRLAPAATVSLVCPYFPYARQDRVCAPGEALSLRVMADLINAQRYTSVEIWDAHSDVTGALLDRVTIIPSLEFVRRIDVCKGTGTLPILVAPDAGAMKKVASVANELKTEWVRADKSRDPKSGAITGTRVYSDPVGDRDFLIVDDICDGGRTFTELAQVLRPLTTGKVFLYVTHGIFSAGYEPILKEIDAIYTANRLRQMPDDPRVHIIGQGE